MSKRKHRNLIISDDISHMGITDTEYRFIEDILDPSLNKEDETSIEPTKKDVINNKNKDKPKNN